MYYTKTHIKLNTSKANELIQNLKRRNAKCILPEFRVPNDLGVERREGRLTMTY